MSTLIMFPALILIINKAVYTKVDTHLVYMQIQAACYMHYTNAGAEFTSTYILYSILTWD